MRTFVSMNIAVIGSGRIVEILAQELCDAGHKVFVGLANENDRISDYLLEEFNKIEMCSITEAAAQSEIVIVASKPSEVREVAYWLDDVRNKVILDLSSEVCDKEEGEYIDTLAAIMAITGAKHAVKCYNCKGFQEVINTSFKKKKIDMMVAGDSLKGKIIAEILGRDLRFKNCYDFGGNKSVPQLDAMTANWNTIAVKEIITQKRIVRQTVKKVR